MTGRCPLVGGGTSWVAGGAVVGGEGGGLATMCGNDDELWAEAVAVAGEGGGLAAMCGDGDEFAAAAVVALAGGGGACTGVNFPLALFLCLGLLKGDGGGGGDEEE